MKNLLVVLASIALGFCLPYLGFVLFAYSLGLFEAPDWALREESQFFPLMRLVLLIPFVVASAYFIARFAPSRAASMGVLASVGGFFALAVQFFSSSANEVIPLASIPRIVWPEVAPLATLPLFCAIWRRRAA